MKAPFATTLPDPVLERVRASHHEAIRELQSAPLAGGLVISGVELADGVPTPIPHRLGRAARWVSTSCVRGAATSGHIEEVRTGADRDRYVTLKAVGWGATINVDVVVA